MRSVVPIAVVFCVTIATKSKPIHAQEQPTDSESQLLRDMHDLMNITKSIHLFANDHDGRLPESLGETLPYIEDWTSWTPSEKLKATPAEKADLYLSSRDAAKTRIPEEVTPAWINKHASYTYFLKPGVKLSDYADLSKTVIAHGKLDQGYTLNPRTDDEITRYPLAMLDAHAESHPKEEIRKLLEATDRK